MARYFVTHQTLTLTCGTLVIDMRTATSDHLWLLYTTIDAGFNPVEDFQQQQTKAHHYNYTATIEGVIEQEEPGNTTTHTFRFPWPANREALWFYTINIGTA